MERMHRMQMVDSDRCPLCNRLEDHEHRVKKCPYLEGMFKRRARAGCAQGELLGISAVLGTFD